MAARTSLDQALSQLRLRQQVEPAPDELTTETIDAVQQLIEAAMEELPRPIERARIHIYAGKRGLLDRKQWRARLVAGNGKNLFVAGEGYNNREELISLCQDVFPGVAILYMDPPSAVS